jgi:hypothetical protein
MVAQIGQELGGYGAHEEVLVRQPVERQLRGVIDFKPDEDVHRRGPHVVVGVIEHPADLQQILGGGIGLGVVDRPDAPLRVLAAIES